MTPKKNKLTPRAAIRWLEELRQECICQGAEHEKKTGSIRKKAS